MNSATFVAISVCLSSAWLFRISSQKPTSSKWLLQASLLLHSLYCLHTILVVPPRNVFTELGQPYNAPADSLRALFLRKSHTGDLEPEIDEVLTKLNSFDLRLLYLRLGHDAVAGCNWCSRFEEYLLYAFIGPVLGYIIEIAFIGSLTLPNSPRHHLRSFAVGTLIVSMLFELFMMLTGEISLSAGDRAHSSWPQITRWHDVLYAARHILFLVLPLSLQLPRIPFIHSIPVVGLLLPVPDPRIASNAPPPAQRLQALQQTLDQLMTRLHFLSYTKAAIMRIPSVRERAVAWWDVEGKEGKEGRADEGMRRTAKGVGFAYDESDGPLLVNAKRGLEAINNSVPPSVHWLKQASAS